VRWEPLWEDGDDSWGAHVVQHNAFVVDEADARLLGVASADEGERTASRTGQPLLALCVPASLANHSCRPACTWRISRSGGPSSCDRLRFAAWTLRPLAAGDAVTIPYWSPLASRARVAECADQFDFACACDEVCDRLDRPVRGLDPCLPRVTVDKLGDSFRRLVARHGVERGVAAPADDGLLDDLMRLVHRYAVVEAVVGDAWPDLVATPACEVSSSLIAPAAVPDAFDVLCLAAAVSEAVDGDQTDVLWHAAAAYARHFAGPAGTLTRRLAQRMGPPGPRLP